MAIPIVQSLGAVIVLVSIAASFGKFGPAANGVLVGDLLHPPADAGRAFARTPIGEVRALSVAQPRLAD